MTQRERIEILESKVQELEQHISAFGTIFAVKHKEILTVERVFYMM